MIMYILTSINRVFGPANDIQLQGYKHCKNTIGLISLEKPVIFTGKIIKSYWYSEMGPIINVGWPAISSIQLWHYNITFS